ncbi:Uncharacterized protein APZ42_000609 [Daphnia magna]|uniref:Uncharacterized protein n=1 Tax=Daphnia magna TaxID=35525 RepID=A0A164JI78_9CRUS|nr:Uncharacterized protein APZ42_000609 [Daphnia magna]
MSCFSKSNRALGYNTTTQYRHQMSLICEHVIVNCDSSHSTMDY